LNCITLILNEIIVINVIITIIIIIVVIARALEVSGRAPALLVSTSHTCACRPAAFKAWPTRTLVRYVKRLSTESRSLFDVRNVILASTAAVYRLMCRRLS
jgi:hypothetical protein